MQYQPDIVVYERSLYPAAIVQVKALSDYDAQLASRYLRNLLDYGVTPVSHYVMLITAKMGYLWTTPEAVLKGAAPILTFPMDRIIQHYFPRNRGPASVGDDVLKLITELWLEDLADGKPVDDAVTCSLREAGFVDSIQGGRVDGRVFA